MYQRRAVGLLLSIAAIAMVLIALVSRSWFEIDGDDEARLGLRSVEQCTKQWESAGGKCRDQSLGGFFRTARDAYETPAPSWDDDGVRQSRPKPVPEGFILLGTLTLLGGLAAMVAIAATLIIAASAPRPGPRGLASATALTCGGFAALAVAFVVAAPGSIDHLRAGLGPLLALVGAGCGVAGVLILGRFDPATESTPAVLAAAAAGAPVSRTPMWIAGGIGCALVLTSIFTQSWFRGRDHDTSLAVGVRKVEVCEPEIARAGGSFESMFQEGAGRGELICRTNLIPASTEGAQQPKRMRIFLAAGNLTWMTGLTSVLVMLLVGGLAGARQAIGGALSAPRVLIAVAGSFLFSSIVFAMSRPSDVADVAISFGPFLALGGAAGLIGAGLMLARWTTAMQLEARRLTAAPPDAATPALPMLGPPAPPPPFAPPLSPFMPPPPVPSPFSAPFASSAPIVIIPACPQCATPMLWVSAKSAWLCTICRPTR